MKYLELGWFLLKKGVKSIYNFFVTNNEIGLTAIFLWLLASVVPALLYKLDSTAAPYDIGEYHRFLFASAAFILFKGVAFLTLYFWKPIHNYVNDPQGLFHDFTQLPSWAKLCLSLSLVLLFILFQALILRAI